MLGLPPVSSWPLRDGPIPWVLDPAEHPRPDDFVNHRDSTAPGDGSGVGGSRKRKRKGPKHHELKVTQKGVGADEPQFFSGSSGSGSDVSDTTAPDSGVNLASPVSVGSGQKKAKVTAPSAPVPGSTTSRMPPLSPDTRRRLDEEAQGTEDSLLDDDDLLSGHSDHTPSDGEGEGDQEMSSADEFSDGGDDGEKGEPMEAGAPGDKEPVAPSTSNDPTTSTTPTVKASGPGETSNPGSRLGNLRDPNPAAALAYAIESRVLASPALAVVMAQMGQGVALDSGEEDKVREAEYAGVMQGLHTIARIMSTGFEKACEAILDVVNDSLENVIQRDRNFIEGASSTLMKWIRAVQPTIDGLGCPGMAQIRLRSDARRDRMKIAREILDPYSGGDANASQTDPLQDIIIRAFAAAREPTELAVITVHEQLAPLVDEYVHPGQERVFLSGAFNVICAYVQEIHSMVLGQAVVPT